MSDDELTVAKILAAPQVGREPERPAERSARAARSALWELDFALQELAWLEQPVARPADLVASIAAQLRRACANLEASDPSHLPLPGALPFELAERSRRLADALERADTLDDPGLQAAYERLRAALAALDVDTD